MLGWLRKLPLGNSLRLAARVGQVPEAAGLAIREKFDQVRELRREDLTPFQQWCLNGGVERAYTGNLWFERDIGSYSCVGCGTQIALSEHKYWPKAGMASFWGHLPNAVTIGQEISQDEIDTTNVTMDEFRNPRSSAKACHCSNCAGFLGVVYSDGPAPTFLRYSLNSGSINFTPKPWWDDPSVYRKRRHAILSKQREEIKVTQSNRFKILPSKYSSLSLKPGVTAERPTRQEIIEKIQRKKNAEIEKKQAAKEAAKAPATTTDKKVAKKEKKPSKSPSKVAKTPKMKFKATPEEMAKINEEKQKLQEERAKKKPKSGGFFKRSVMTAEDLAGSEIFQRLSTEGSDVIKVRLDDDKPGAKTGAAAAAKPAADDKKKAAEKKDKEAPKGKDPKAK
jgi:peptide-methionine (R)-S-oxide reductase